MSIAALVFDPIEALSSNRKVVVDPKFSADPFSLGVASGDPRPDGAVLWTRLAPDPLNGGGMPDVAVPVRLRVATDESMRNVVREGTVSNPRAGTGTSFRWAKSAAR
jgi:phosphodiesterase/alkaline phosphatase D-like protein